MTQTSLERTVRVLGVDLLVGPGGFTPQPETEPLLHWVIEHLAGDVVVDLCSGVGTVPVALAAALPARVQVHAVERSAEALHWLRRNVERSGGRVQVHHVDAAEALPELDGSVDVVVSNPPYVATHELPLLVGTVAEHEPELAVHGGADGLDVIRVVAATAWRLLRPGGLLAVEHSDRQGQSAPALLRELGWADVADHPDQLGRDRFVTAVRPGGPAPA